jgi:hypothetical protein
MACLSGELAAAVPASELGRREDSLLGDEAISRLPIRTLRDHCAGVLDPMLNTHFRNIEIAWPGLDNPLVQGKRFHETFLLQTFIGVVSKEQAARDRTLDFTGIELGVALVTQEWCKSGSCCAQPRCFP